VFGWGSVLRRGSKSHPPVTGWEALNRRFPPDVTPGQAITIRYAQQAAFRSRIQDTQRNSDFKTAETDWTQPYGGMTYDEPVRHEQWSESGWQPGGWFGGGSTAPIEPPYPSGPPPPGYKSW
jgi:hypothetical protein